MVVKLKIFVAFVSLILPFTFACGKKTPGPEAPETETVPPSNVVEPQILKTGAGRVGEYLPLLEGKRIALTVNQTSMIDGTHLVDSLVALGVVDGYVWAGVAGDLALADPGPRCRRTPAEARTCPCLS